MTASPALRRSGFILLMSAIVAGCTDPAHSREAVDGETAAGRRAPVRGGEPETPETRYFNGTQTFTASNPVYLQSGPNLLFLHAKADLFLSNHTLSWVRFEWTPSGPLNQEMRAGAYFDDNEAQAREPFGLTTGPSPLTVTIPKTPLTDRLYIGVWVAPKGTEPTLEQSVTMTHSISYEGQGAVLSQTFAHDAGVLS